MNKKSWHAIYTRSRAEKKTEQLIRERGFEAYLPLIKTLRRWSDRKKMVEVPLITSYVFVRVNAKEYDEILKVPGVVTYVTFEGKPAKIRDAHMEILQAAVEHNITMELQKSKLKAGEKVKVIAGPLKGAEGEFVAQAHKTKFVLKMLNIGFVLTIEIDAADVVKVS